MAIEASATIALGQSAEAHTRTLNASAVVNAKRQDTKATLAISEKSAEAHTRTLNASAVVNVRRQDASGTLEISENGTYNVATFAEVAVAVPIPSNYGLITWNGSTLTVS